MSGYLILSSVSLPPSIGSDSTFEAFLLFLTDFVAPLVSLTGLVGDSSSSINSLAGAEAKKSVEDLKFEEMLS